MISDQKNVQEACATLQFKLARLRFISRLLGPEKCPSGGNEEFEDAMLLDEPVDKATESPDYAVT